MEVGHHIKIICNDCTLITYFPYLYITTIHFKFNAIMVDRLCQPDFCDRSKGHTCYFLFIYLQNASIINHLHYAKSSSSIVTSGIYIERRLDAFMLAMGYCT